MIQTGKIWHVPLNTYWHIQKASKKYEPKAVEKMGKFKSLREARIGAIVALAMFKKMGKLTYL